MNRRTALTLAAANMMLQLDVLKTHIESVDDGPLFGAAPRQGIEEAIRIIIEMRDAEPE
jgi:hypothetical protein